MLIDTLSVRNAAPSALAPQARRAHPELDALRGFALFDVLLAYDTRQQNALFYWHKNL